MWSPTLHPLGNAVAKALLNNWQLSSITTLASGRPYGSPTISVSSGPTLPTGESLITTSYIDGFTGNTRVPWLPVNSILTPAIYKADARLSKFIPIKIADRETRLSLNFEVFNVSNSWSPTSMTTHEYTAVKGVLEQQPITSYGEGSADGGFPDGTQARRMQVSARFTF